MSEDAIVRIIMQNDSTTHGANTTSQSATGGMSGLPLGSSPADKFYRELSRAVIDINKQTKISSDAIIGKLEEIRSLLDKDYDYSEKEYQESKSQTSILKLIGATLAGDKSLGREITKAAGLQSSDTQTVNFLDKIQTNTAKMSENIQKLFPERQKSWLETSPIAKTLNMVGNVIAYPFEKMMGGKFGDNPWDLESRKKKEPDSIMDLLAKGKGGGPFGAMQESLTKIEKFTDLTAGYASIINDKLQSIVTELTPNKKSEADSLKMDEHPEQTMGLRMRLGDDALIDEDKSDPHDPVQQDRRRRKDAELREKEKLDKDKEKQEKKKQQEQENEELDKLREEHDKKVEERKKEEQNILNEMAAEITANLSDDLSDLSDFAPQRGSGPDWGASNLPFAEQEEDISSLPIADEIIEDTPPTSSPNKPEDTSTLPIPLDPEFDIDDITGGTEEALAVKKTKLGIGTPSKLHEQMQKLGIAVDKSRTKVNTEDYKKYKEREESLRSDGRLPGDWEEFAQGGLVGGTGAGDTQPIMATPGEVVIPKGMVQGGAIDHLRGKLPGFSIGGMIMGGVKGVGGAAYSAMGSTISIGTDASSDTGSTIGKVGSAIGVMGDQLMKANPMIGAFVKGIGMAGEAFGALVSAINETANRYGEYSPEIAQAQAIAEINQTMGDLRRAQEAGPELARFVIAQGEMQQKFEDIKIKLLMKITPVATKILEILEELMADSEGIEGGLFALLSPITAMAAALDSLAGTSRDAAAPIVEDPATMLLRAGFDERSGEYVPGR